MPDDGAAGQGVAQLRRIPARPRCTSTRLRRTPCVGICSTTYGDLVCRGCKRFAHEVVAWNGYEETQREAVWRRLQLLLAASVRAHVRIADATLLRAAARQAGVVAEETNTEALAFHTMRLRPLPLADLGLAPARDAALDTRQVIAAIDREFYLRSQAHYEASFKMLV